MVVYPKFQATWQSGIPGIKSKIARDVSAGVREHLTNIRDRWAADVRVDTAHYKETVEQAQPKMTSPTEGSVAPEPFEVYFAANEYGGPTISARPSMQQAVEAERSTFYSWLDSLISNAGSGR